jgi:hypothetical protein
VFGFFFFFLKKYIFFPNEPKTRDTPASASQVLGLQVCTTMPSLLYIFSTHLSTHKTQYNNGIFKKYKMCTQVILKVNSGVQRVENSKFLSV